jgi:hypothetical protein
MHSAVRTAVRASLFAFRRSCFAARVLILVAVVSSSALAQAGQPEQRRQQPRRQATIEIRGQVPTPQVVTVRPREAPAFNRRVLVPAFLDRDFWPSILPALHVVTPVATPGDAPRADSVRTVPADSTQRIPANPPRPPSGLRPSGIRPSGIRPAPPR